MRVRGRLLILFISLPLVFSCSDAPEVPLLPTNRVVLAEFFTWQRCVYCPYAAHTLESLTKEFADSVVVIAYHRRVAGDTLSPDYVETRRAFYYESGGEPATVFDGGEVVRTPGPEYNYETFRNYIIGAKANLPRAQLSVAMMTDSLNGRVVVRAWGVDFTPPESLNLFIVIIEDSIRERLPGATDSVFNSVMRLMLPDVNGQRVWLARGDTVLIEERFALNRNWHRENLRAVAFVQDITTRRVFQTAQSGLTTRR